MVKGFSKYKSLFPDEKLFRCMQETLANGEYFQWVKNRLEAESITPIFWGGEGYPKEWMSISDAPLCLYLKGRAELLAARKLAIVGSRRTTESAKQLGTIIAKDVSASFVVVTGAADGGDEAALKGGLATGNVICFSAGGFGALPKENLLLREVEKKGLLITACPYDTPIRVYSYEYRNKLLAAMSEGTLVLGAAKKSGSLVTAKYAQEFGKKLFAIPYAPSVVAGEGCNALIKQGAYLTENASDILMQYGFTAMAKPKVLLTDAEQKIVDVLTECGEMHVTDLSKSVGLPVFKLATLLALLEVKGLAVKLGGNRYSVV